MSSCEVEQGAEYTRSPRAIYLPSCASEANPRSRMLLTGSAHSRSETALGEGAAERAGLIISTR